METEIQFDSFTEYGNPLEITIKLYFYQDESILTGKLFWTYDILSIKGVGTKRGESFDYEIDENEYKEEIDKACNEELESFKRAA